MMQFKIKVKSMNRVAVIGVPSSAGAHGVGQERAPQSFRQAGFMELLSSLGLDVIDFGELPEVSYRPDPHRPNQQNLALVCDVIKQVTKQVNRAIFQDAKPIVIGGDCTITLGVIAGLVNQFPNLGLIYLDGGTDLNTPKDSHTGILDGMGLAHIIGKGAYEMTHIGHRYPLMDEEKILLFGYNPDSGWMDEAETKRLEVCSMIKYPLSKIRGKPEEAALKALSQLEVNVDQILVHFDIDVIDFSDFPVADVPHENGLSFSETMKTLKVFISNPKFAGLVITEFNADRDKDGTLSQKFINGIIGTLKLGHNHW